MPLQNFDHSRRLTEMRDDLEPMIKTEIGGRFAHFDTRMEHTLSPLVDRIGALETR